QPCVISAANRRSQVWVRRNCVRERWDRPFVDDVVTQRIYFGEKLRPIAYLVRYLSVNKILQCHHRWALSGLNFVQQQMPRQCGERPQKITERNIEELQQSGRKQ